MSTITRSFVLVTVLLAGCSKSADQEPPKSVVEAAKPVADSAPPKPALPPLVFVGEPVKQAADFPVERWVRTTVFGGKKSFVGFTYRDHSKGNSIKGEPADGLSKMALATKLRGFPSTTMQPIPEGHAMTLLSDAEIKELGLPKAPDWLKHFK